MACCDRCRDADKKWENYHAKGIQVHKGRVQVSRHEALQGIDEEHKDSSMRDETIL